MKARIFLAVCLLLAGLGPTASAATFVAADWLSTSTGTLNGVAFTSSGFGGPFLNIDNRTYTGTDFSAAPVGMAEGLQYSANNDWSVAFSSPVSGLLLVVDSWRGNYNTNVADPTSTYTFSRPFQIASGLSGAAILGNTLSLPDREGGLSFYSGVLFFPGTVSSLSVDATALNASGQDLTFAVEASAVAEHPSSLLLLCTSVLGLIAASRRWNSSPIL